MRGRLNLSTSSTWIFSWATMWPSAVAYMTPLRYGCSVLRHISSMRKVAKIFHAWQERAALLHEAEIQAIVYNFVQVMSRTMVHWRHRLRQHNFQSFLAHEHVINRNNASVLIAATVAGAHARSHGHMERVAGPLRSRSADVRGR